ncbi:MAG: EamA family transporter [Lachnospiraceae bacterium]|nr:EamA family transporter [Lachnospiraceae bacterium]
MRHKKDRFGCGSWICYFYAIKNGIVSVVVPIDKMSIVVTVLFSYIIFKEKLTKKAMIGLGLMVIATVFMAIYG